MKMNHNIFKISIVVNFNSPVIFNLKCCISALFDDCLLLDSVCE